MNAATDLEKIAEEYGGGTKVLSLSAPHTSLLFLWSESRSVLVLFLSQSFSIAMHHKSK